MPTPPPANPAAGAAPELPPGADQPKLTAPAIPSDIDALWADVLDQTGQVIKMKDQTQMTRDKRLARIKEQRENAEDEQTRVGRGIGSKLAEADTNEQMIDLDEAEMTQLGLTDLTDADMGILEGIGWNRGSPSQFSRRSLHTMLGDSLRELDGGRRDIYRPAAGLKDNEAIIREGQRRINGEASFVTAQTALLELARRQGRARDFSSAIISAHQALNYANGQTAATANPRLSDAPRWFTDDLILQVASAGNHPDERAQLETLASLTAYPNLTAEGGLLHEYAGSIQKATAKLQEIRQQEAAVAQATREREGREKKKAIHDERLATLEDDTFQAGIALGRNDFIAHNSANGPVSGDEHHAIEGRAEVAGVPSAIGILFGTMRTNVAFNRMCGDAQIQRELRPIATLRSLQLLTENPELFESVVQTLAERVTQDFTGYSRTDYEKPEDWLKYWRGTLRRSIYGYSLGMVEAAVSYEPDPAHPTKLENLDALRSQTFQVALETIFGEKHMLDKTQIAAMDPTQQRALILLGTYRKSLNSADQTVASKRLQTYLESTLAVDAVTAVKSRREVREQARLTQLQETEAFQKQLTAESAQVLEQIATTIRMRDVDMALTRVYWEELRSLQTGQDWREWVAISTRDSGNPMLVLSNKAQVMTAENSRLEGEIARLESGSDAQKQVKLARLREQRERLQARVDLLNRLQKKIAEYNDPSHKTTVKSGFGSKGVWKEHTFHGITGGWGLIAESDEKYYTQQSSSIFGPVGTFTECQKTWETLQIRAQTAAIPHERKEILVEAQGLVKRIQDAQRFVSRFRDTISLDSKREYAVNQILAQVVQELARKNLFEPDPYSRR